jgi:hypothetical protein
LGIPARRRRWRSMLGFVFLAAIFGMSIGCGGGGGTSGVLSSGTTPGSYSVTVTGTDTSTGKITSSTVVNVTVN